MRSSAATTGASSPAVSRLARYCSGMRRLRTSGSCAESAELAGIGGRGDRRQRRHVPDHRQRAVFRVQRQRDFPVHRHLVDRRGLRRLDPGFGHAVVARLRLHLGAFGSRNRPSCALYRSFSSGHARRIRDAVGVVEQHAEVADAADAGFRAHRRLAGFDARVAEDALLGLAASASCNRSSCTGSPTRTCASRGTCPGRSARCRPPRACRSSPTGTTRRRSD